MVMLCRTVILLTAFFENVAYQQLSFCEKSILLIQQYFPPSERCDINVSTKGHVMKKNLFLSWFDHLSAHSRVLLFRSDGSRCRIHPVQKQQRPGPHQG